VKCGVGVRADADGAPLAEQYAQRLPPFEEALAILERGLTGTEPAHKGTYHDLPERFIGQTRQLVVGETAQLEKAWLACGATRRWVDR
jgi:hypothetical protein